MRNKEESRSKNCLLQIEGLTKLFPGYGKREPFTAVDHVDLQVNRGEILGLLGESGSGKSTLANMIMKILPVTAGSIRYEGREIQDLSQKEFRTYRKKMQMIFQNPFSCLDPRCRIRTLLMEPFKIWKTGEDERICMEKIEEILKECGLSGSDVLAKRASEFSGGQLQRLAIARALLAEPEFLVADEIVSALDVPVQNQILELLLSLREKRDLTLIMITHDLTVMSAVSDRVAVMRSGRIVQEGLPLEIIRSDNAYVRELRRSAYIF